MSQARNLQGQISPATGKPYSIDLILDVMEIPRSTYYDRVSSRPASPLQVQKRGPKTSHSDLEVVQAIREILAEPMFSGEGHRKVTARLGLKEMYIGKNRVLRLMRIHGLLAPVRKYRIAQKRIHDGRIITDRPNEMWGGDITEVMTEEDGKVYIFDMIDHCTAEVIGAYVTTNGNRFSAINCLHEAMKGQLDEVKKDKGRGIKLRLDHGTQFTSKRYVNEAHHLCFELSYSFVGQPECNGIIERWHRTLKEQVLWTRSWKTVKEVKTAVLSFVEKYNENWLLGRHGYVSPLKYKQSLANKAVA
jgi:putative transposase